MATSSAVLQVRYEHISNRHPDTLEKQMVLAQLEVAIQTAASRELLEESAAWSRKITEESLEAQRKALESING